MKKTFVIGSGFGGLAIACRLKAMGHDVTVLEKLDNLGGRARTLYHNEFEYDAGPTVITAPYLLNELFSLFNKDSRDYFNLLELILIIDLYSVINLTLIMAPLLSQCLDKLRLITLKKIHSVISVFSSIQKEFLIPHTYNSQIIHLKTFKVCFPISPN